MSRAGLIGANVTIAGLFLGLLAFAPLGAQAPPAPASPPVAPVLSELQTLQFKTTGQAIELARYKAREAQADYDRAIAEARALVERFERDNPGWTIDPSIIVIAKPAPAKTGEPKQEGRK